MRFGIFSSSFFVFFGENFRKYYVLKRAVRSFFGLAVTRVVRQGKTKDSWKIKAGDGWMVRLRIIRACVNMPAAPCTYTTMNLHLVTKVKKSKKLFSGILDFFTTHAS